MGNDPLTFVVVNLICLLLVNAAMSPLGRCLWRLLKAVGMWTMACAAAAWQGFARATGRSCACVWHVFRMATIRARHVLCSLFRYSWSAFRSIVHQLSHTQNRSEIDLEAGDSRSLSPSTGSFTNADPNDGGLIGLLQRTWGALRVCWEALSAAPLRRGEGSITAIEMNRFRSNRPSLQVPQGQQSEETRQEDTLDMG